MFEKEVLQSKKLLELRKETFIIQKVSSFGGGGDLMKGEQERTGGDSYERLF